MMLRAPTEGFAQSVSKHNGDLSIQADWLEASALFTSDTITRSDVVDMLIENQTYNTQDYASVWVGAIFNELERRFRVLGDAGVLVRDGSRIRRVAEWRTRPAYSFCVALSMVPHYRKEVEDALGRNYGLQGQLFELLSAESLAAGPWHVAPVAWSRKETSTLTIKVQKLAQQLGEPAHDHAVARWTAPDAKDAGLDLVAWTRHPDGWGGRPICLVQCASGRDWMDKLHTPNVETWRKLIDFSTAPRKALAMPFAPDEKTFRLKANTDGLMMLLDRHRLVAPDGAIFDSFPSKGLAKKLNSWTANHQAVFPVDTN